MNKEKMLTLGRLAVIAVIAFLIHANAALRAEKTTLQAKLHAIEALCKGQEAPQAEDLARNP